MAISRQAGVDLSVYDDTGALLATSTEPPVELDVHTVRLREALHPPHAGAPHAADAQDSARPSEPSRHAPAPTAPPPTEQAPHASPQTVPSPLYAPPPTEPPHAPLPTAPTARHAPAQAEPPLHGPPPPPPPPPPGPGGPPPRFPVRLADGATLMVQFQPRLAAWAAPLLTLLAGLVVIGVGAVLTARRNARPLDRLARTARAVGAGELGARTGVTADDEIGDVATAFDDMARRIERLVKAERELLANVSHELRTPLARIRVAMDLAQEGDAEAARASLHEIATDLAELDLIVDDVLLALRMDVERARPELLARSREDVRPHALLDKAVERFRARHADRPLVVDTEPQGDPFPVRVDPPTFRRVLDNLLENAHKYSPDPAAPITVSIATTAEATTFLVTDRGAGIAPEDLPRVFEPFFRADLSRARGAGGVGLGLTLARRIVEAHGGTIGIASELGKGTSVRVTLPRARP
jgi:signal transduction histidine kinase